MERTEADILAEWAWLLTGRQLLLSSLPVELAADLKATRASLHQIQIQPAISDDGVNSSRICQRCQSPVPNVNRLPSGQYYCASCLTMGRVTSGDELVHLPAMTYAKGNTLTWQGELTSAQRRVSNHILQQFHRHNRHQQLLWAVTGAGKTEMTFPVIADFLQQGQRIGFVSPRVDVCNELFPRVEQAFKNTPVGLFHGQIYEAYRNEQIVIGTTHQLLRYDKAFDLLIVDEVDAFPYVNDAMLQRAVERAVKPTGLTLFLSATPPRVLLRAAKSDQLPLHYLARRFHGRELPLPRIELGDLMHGRHFAPKLQRIFDRLLQASRRFLVFVPQIAVLEQLGQLFEQSYPQVVVTTVHAADSKRLEKVQRFRDGEAQVLFTTTILERGVTFADIDVVVLSADHRNYSVASLVQVAGRVGRAREFPNGQVIFYSRYYTNKIRLARQMIRHLNREGGF